MSIKSKVSVIGVGNVGRVVAYSVAMQGLAHEVILLGRNLDKVKGEALDMNQASAAMRSHSVVKVAQSYKDIKDSKIVVITAGQPRKEGMSRDDLLIKNAEIVKEISENIKIHAPESIILVVSNPLDVMTYVALKCSGFPKERVLGMAGILDAARMTHFIQEKLGYGAGQIRVSVIGGHGDSMVLLPRFTTVAGVPLYDLLRKGEVDEIVQKTIHAGAEIVKYMGSSAYLAPGKSAAIMIDAILRDTKKIFSCSIMMDNEYNYKGKVNGVPVMLGSGGGERILEFVLDENEKKEFSHSINSVEKMIQLLKGNNFFD